MSKYLSESLRHTHIFRITLNPKPFGYRYRSATVIHTQVVHVSTSTPLTNTHSLLETLSKKYFQENADCQTLQLPELYAAKLNFQP